MIVYCTNVLKSRFLQVTLFRKNYVLWTHCTGSTVVRYRRHLWSWKFCIWKSNHFFLFNISALVITTGLPYKCWLFWCIEINVFHACMFCLLQVRACIRLNQWNQLGRRRGCSSTSLSAINILTRCACSFPLVFHRSHTFALATWFFIKFVSGCPMVREPHWRCLAPLFFSQCVFAQMLLAVVMWTRTFERHEGDTYTVSWLCTIQHTVLIEYQQPRRVWKKKHIWKVQFLLKVTYRKNGITSKCSCFGMQTTQTMRKRWLKPILNRIAQRKGACLWWERNFFSS